MTQQGKTKVVSPPIQSAPAPGEKKRPTEIKGPYDDPEPGPSGLTEAGPFIMKKDRQLRVEKKKRKEVLPVNKVSHLPPQCGTPQTPPHSHPLNMKQKNSCVVSHSLGPDMKARKTTSQWPSSTQE